MLARIGRLIECNRRFAFDQENIEIFSQENRHRFAHGSDDPAFDVGYRIDDVKAPVLEDRVGVQNEESRFHN